MIKPASPYHGAQLLFSIRSRPASSEMQSSSCDGLPVQYSHSDSTSEDPRRTCTTQSPVNSRDYPHLEALYAPSLSLDVAETVHPGTPQAVHYPQATDTATQTFPLSPVLPSTDPSQAMWPTPPPTTCEDFEDYTYQGSPTSAGFGAHNPALAVIPSIESPRSWSSAAAHQYAYQQAIWRSQEPTPPYNMQANMDMPNEDLYHQQMQAPPYAPTGFHNSTMESDATTDPVGASDRSLSPASHHDLGSGYGYGDQDTGPLPGQGVDVDEDGTTDEPYAQLIFRALMSRESHSMTLQEIYQWFREETTKAKGDGSKGWQNSIRHNLSMNQAFVKRDKKPAPGDPVTESGEPKKSSEWVLEDWAAEGGVQSTTRYRTKGHASRRSGSGVNRSQSNQQNHLSARASSGRRGGITASRTRAAASRASLRRQQYGEIMAPQIPGNNFQRTHGFYSRQGSMEFAAAPNRGDQVTSPEMSAGDILYGHALHGGQAMGPAAGEGYYYAPGQPHRPPHSQGHGIELHAHQALPHSQPNPYRLEDVTSVYEPSPISHSAANGDPSLLATHVPAAFNNLFADDIGGENMTGASMRINLNYGWDNSSQFQS